MKIAFIRPSMFGVPVKDALKPLIFSIIKPLTPDFVEIAFYDEMIETLPEEIDAEVVAFTVDTFSAKRAYQLAADYRTIGKTILMGGFHPSAVPDECLNYADAVFVGEAEDTWGAALQDLMEHKLKRSYISTNRVDLSTVVYDHSVYEGKRYPRLGLVQFSRGCKYRCDFCAIHGFYSGRVRSRPVAHVAAELASMKEKFIFFIDDNLFADEQAAAALFEAILPLKKRWVCQISMDVAENPALLHKMKESGCIMVLMGFESLDPGNLKRMGKTANLHNLDYDRVIRQIYEAGLMIYGTFVVGYDHDTAETAMGLARFAFRHRFAIANFNPLMALPGTVLFERLEKANQLTCPEWWRHPEYRYGDAMLKPANMTEKDLMESCRQARYFFSSYQCIGIRLFHSKANLRNMENAYIYLAANLISRVQIKMKQGRKLGGVL